MYLKSLELSGFKSFAKKSNLSFESSITGIVGPNGSGKSNIAEAFRFVLGEQSIKSLRGKRGEDMIWNGGGDVVSGSSRANRASVKLIFDNSRRLFPNLDFDEVSVERIVYRDNTNEYFLNGSHVRLKDVIEVLAAAHIGASGHHIISQGEADRILSASIREKREMIEDALGLKIYQWKKLESIKKLEKTEENMESVESLRREIAPHLKFLKKQVEKVEKAEEVRKELIVLYREYFRAEENYLFREKSIAIGEIANPKLELSELDRNLDISKKVLIDSKNKDRKSDEIIRLEKLLSEVRNEKDSITRDLGRMEGEINAAKRAVNREQSRIRDEETRTVYLRDVEDVVTSIERFGNIDDVKKLFADVVNTLRDFISRHRISIESDVMKDAEMEINKLSMEKSEAETKLRSYSENESKCLNDYNELRAAIEKDKDTNREAEKEMFRIIARQNEIRGIINTLNSKLNVINSREEEFKRELGEAGIIVGREAVDYKSDVSEVVLAVEDDKTHEERRRKIERLKIRFEDSGISGSGEVMKEFKETEERDSFLERELLDLNKAKKELLGLINELDLRIDYEFKSGILKINSEFQKYFRLMFGGGIAELVVIKENKRRKQSDTDELGEMLNNAALSPSDEDHEDETVDGPDGLDVNVSLPRKKVKGLMMLSGGERALTSIALLFAISQVNPPPFIILDETDAALDEANSKKYGDMINDLAKNSQLILITHNRETMSRAGVLFGITMGNDGASRLLSIAFEQALAVAK